MSVIEVADDDGMARELLSPSKQERTAHWTHCACTGARLLFLFSHGVWALSISTSLEHLSEASWGVLFLPIWIGDALCAVLIIASWFLSCPYIKFCLEMRQQRRGINNPSILTEILPEILMAIASLFFLLIIFFGEYALFSYLESEQKGHPHTLAVVVVLLGFSGTVAVCYGVIIVYNSMVHVAVGAGTLGTVVVFACTRQSPVSTQAFCLIPIACCVFGLLVDLAWRFAVTLHVLTREERLLRLCEIAALGVLLFAVSTFAQKVSSDAFSEARILGMVAGASMCFMAVLRLRMCWLELWQPVTERMLRDRRTVSASDTVQISELRDSQLIALSG